MHFSHQQWELFIDEACVERKLGTKRYAQVKRLGNAGDAGRDVEARLTVGRRLARLSSRR
jgi:hypothetical protein